MKINQLEFLILISLVGAAFSAWLRYTGRKTGGSR